jgi:hypothetical protein
MSDCVPVDSIGRIKVSGCCVCAFTWTRITISVEVHFTILSQTSPLICQSHTGSAFVSKTFLRIPTPDGETGDGEFRLDAGCRLMGPFNNFGFGDPARFDLYASPIDSGCPWTGNPAESNLAVTVGIAMFNGAFIEDGGPSTPCDGASPPYCGSAVFFPGSNTGNPFISFGDWDGSPRSFTTTAARIGDPDVNWSYTLTIDFA